jgi:hypothetical protein
VNDASGENNGAGDFTKVVERTTPTRLGGGFVAMESAMGPENDSPRSTKGAMEGNAVLTRASSAA